MLKTEVWLWHFYFKRYWTDIVLDPSQLQGFLFMLWINIKFWKCKFICKSITMIILKYSWISWVVLPLPPVKGPMISSYV